MSEQGLQDRACVDPAPASHINQLERELLQIIHASNDPLRKANRALELLDELMNLKGTSGN